MNTETEQYLSTIDRLIQKLGPINGFVDRIADKYLSKATASAHVTCVPGGCTYVEYECTSQTCFWSGSNPPACYMTNYMKRWYLCPGDPIYHSCKECHSCDCGGCQIYHYGVC